MSGQDPRFDQDHPAVVDDGVDDAAKPPPADPSPRRDHSASRPGHRPSEGSSPVTQQCCGAPARPSLTGKLDDGAALSAAGWADWPVG